MRGVCMRGECMRGVHSPDLAFRILCSATNPFFFDAAATVLLKLESIAITVLW
jgi:hypothetical protein